MTWQMEKDDDGNDYLVNIEQDRKGNQQVTDETPPIPWRLLFPIGMEFDKGVPVLIDTQGREFYLINASEWQEGFSREGWIDYPDGGHLICLWFGQISPMLILMWTSKFSFEAALEDAAGFLEGEGLKGYFVDDAELKDLIEEAKKELSEDSDNEEGESLDEKAYDQATADLTYTESGYITSYEWGEYSLGRADFNLAKAAYIISRLMHPTDEDPEWDGTDRAPSHMRPSRF